MTTGTSAENAAQEETTQKETVQEETAQEESTTQARTLDEIKADGTIKIGVFSDKNPFG